MAPTKKLRHQRALRPLERLAELHKSAILQQTTLQHVAKHETRCSMTHLLLVLKGSRRPSRELAERICTFVGIPPIQFFGTESFEDTPYRKNSNIKS